MIRGTPKREKGNTYNRNDKEGDEIFNNSIVSIVFLIVFLALIIAFAAIKMSKQDNRLHYYIILSGAIISLIISFSTGIDVYMACKEKPIKILYAVSARITRGIRTPPILDPYKYFRGAREFEANHTAIKAEILKLNEDNIPLTKTTFSGANNYIGKNVRVENGKKVGWRIMTVSVGTHIPQTAREVCPTLVRLVEKYKDQVKSCVVSILPPRTKIPQHVGYYKGVLRYMLGVQIPKERKNVYICVNDKKIVWKEGKSVMFDDCFPHKVINSTNERRIVIYIDIIRPLGSHLLNKLNEWIIHKIHDNPIVTDEIKKTEQLVDL